MEPKVTLRKPIRGRRNSLRGTNPGFMLCKQGSALLGSWIYGEGDSALRPRPVVAHLHGSLTYPFSVLSEVATVRAR